MISREFISPFKKEEKRMDANYKKSINPFVCLPIPRRQFMAVVGDGREALTGIILIIIRAIPNYQNQKLVFLTKNKDNI